MNEMWLRELNCPIWLTVNVHSKEVLNISFFRDIEANILDISDRIFDSFLVGTCKDGIISVEDVHHCASPVYTFIDFGLIETNLGQFLMQILLLVQSQTGNGIWSQRVVHAMEEHVGILGSSSSLSQEVILPLDDSIQRNCCVRIKEVGRISSIGMQIFRLGVFRNVGNSIRISRPSVTVPARFQRFQKSMEIVRRQIVLVTFIPDWLACCQHKFATVGMIRVQSSIATHVDVGHKLFIGIQVHVLLVHGFVRWFLVVLALRRGSV
mmetsp:Transcript_22323/g.48520  ORF Transcript_22323/g.48520 Transcript_22323/m.48520 type:complete len:266 (-) Transcript_22323:1904-2701(-)